MSDLLYSVKDVFSSYLEDNEKKRFFIPLYQRGYKWESKQVTKLLTDINSFDNSQGGKFYCLQNITIVPKDDEFNVVDGQQRLTTLVTLLSFLNEEELVKDKIAFPLNSIRSQTNAFISDFITSKKTELENVDWDSFISLHPNYDHQDIYHIFMAYKVIMAWFKNDLDLKARFTYKLLNNVKLIVNRVDESNSEEKVFGNLNSKRVPLDGADLVRAILITRVAHEEGKKESDIKNIVRVNERRVKIGWELDAINNWWSKKEVNGYFHSFINIKSEEIAAGSKLFKEETYPLNLLLLLFAEKNGEKVLSLELIQRRNNDALSLYKELLKLHNTLQDWFTDRTIYHYLGFLFNNKDKNNNKQSFLSIWRLWEKCSTRQLFIDELKKEIKKTLFGDDDIVDFTDTTVDWYHFNHEDLVKSLVLLDIIHATMDNQAFMPFDAFNKAKNDIEHIFPQNPEKVEDKKDYINFLNRCIEDDRLPFDTSEYDKNKDNMEYLKTADDFIAAQIKEIKINSIGNLVLLHFSVNRSLGRISYSKKRARIIQYFNEGNYIQPHTFKVFARYFVGADNLSGYSEYWTQEDIIKNTEAIQKSIQKFFN